MIPLSVITSLKHGIQDYSRGNEQVGFIKPISADGQVEIYKRPKTWKYLL